MSRERIPHQETPVPTQHRILILTTQVAGKVLDEYKAERGITGPVTGQSNKIATEDPTNLDIGVGERMNEEEV